MTDNELKEQFKRILEEQKLTIKPHVSRQRQDMRSSLKKPPSVHWTGCRGKKGVDVQRLIESNVRGKDSAMGFMIIGLFFAILATRSGCREKRKSGRGVRDER